ncbi:MAG: epoxyqueuosine reductase QueH [Clostridiales bacterium]|nr:epoxyqueuosine reductase QueH [Clostridiales bacterium]
MKKETSGLNIVNTAASAGTEADMMRISADQRKPSLLLHACCGPCSTSCVERLVDQYSITVFYYNPNITDREEYYLRRDTLLQFLKAFNEEHSESGFVDYMEGEYEPDRYIAKCGPLKDEPEGGRRCDLCFAMRLAETARRAGELSFDYFTTTMSVSPHKNYDKIKTLGLSLEEMTSARFLDVDFKKKNGFGRSVELSRKYGLYRQNFCGCDYARYAVREHKG